MSEIAIIIKRRLLAFMLALCDNEKFEGKLNPDESKEYAEYIGHFFLEFFIRR